MRCFWNRHRRPPIVYTPERLRKRTLALIRWVDMYNPGLGALFDRMNEVRGCVRVIDSVYEEWKQRYKLKKGSYELKQGG